MAVAKWSFNPHVGLAHGNPGEYGCIVLGARTLGMSWPGPGLWKRDLEIL